MRLLLQIFAFTLFTSLLSGQINTEDFKNMKFRNIGPAGMSGRITAIDVDLSNQDRIFVGSASGGVWLSENGGISWKAIFDDQSALSIGSIAINQQNPAEIWVGTGEGNPRNSVNTGGGIFKSLDGGKTWNMMGLEKTKVIHRVIINKNNPEIVYAAALGSPWGDHQERGVYKTTDGGKTWKNTLFIDQRTGPADLIVDPSNPNKLIAAMWDHRRTPWDFTSGGKGSGMYITYDGGENWKRLGEDEGMPAGDLGRMGLAYAPSKPNIVYALIEAKENGMYKSTDGGANWKLIQKDDIGNRPFYYADLFVDPQNENRVYNLYTYVSRSEDGAKSFKIIADYGNGVHPDHHAFWISPTDPEFLINGNDGGANISRDGGDTWEFVDNIPVGQFYHANIDNDFPYHVYGGMQDNGSWIGPSYVLKSGGIRNYDWQELAFGDGFDVVPDLRNSRYGFAQSQGGSIGRYDRETGRSMFVKPVHPEHKPLRFNWNAAVAQDPFNESGLYFGSQFVHYSDDDGMTWAVISPDLTSNDTTKQKQDKSGGLTIDATNAENHTTILAIGPSPVDNNVVWAATDDGLLQITRDGGNTWNNTSNRLPGLPTGSWIPQIEVSHVNAGEAFVVANNYRRNDYTPYAYHTTDYGVSWSRIADNRQISHFVCSIIQDDVEPNLLFMGTDGGLFVSFDKGNNWQHWDEGFPNVQIRDMKIHPREGDLILATFGRAFWVLDDINPLRAIAATGKSLLDKDFVAFAPQDAYHVSYRSYDGIRFTAQGEYVGDNRSMGSAALKLWIKPQEKKDDKKKKKGKKEKKKKVKIQVIDMNGDTLRTINRDVEEGFNVVRWGLEREGVRFPSTREPRPDSDKPGGMDVMPGKYKIVYNYKDHKDSTEVLVKLDPRVPEDMGAIRAKEEMTKEYYAVAEKATEGYDRLKKAKKSIKLINGVMKAQQDTSKNEIVKMSKDIEGKVDSLIDLYFTPSGLKGIQRNPNVLSSVVRSVSGYLNSSWSAPGDNTKNVFNRAKMETDRVTGLVNAFFLDEWPGFEEKVKAYQVNLFSDMEEKKE